MYINSLSISNTTGIDNKNVNFGQKIATRNVLALASDRCCYKGNFGDNVKIIKDLATYKSSLEDLTAMGWACTFGAVAKVLLNKYPSLKPFVGKVKKLDGNDIPKFDESFSKIVEKAEKN